MAARQVILYFDDQQDALRFALAAGSVMSGEGQNGELIQETQRARRILLEEAGNPRNEKPSGNMGAHADGRAKAHEAKAPS
jgi:hypothetical protein